MKITSTRQACPVEVQAAKKYPMPSIVRFANSSRRVFDRFLSPKNSILYQANRRMVSSPRSAMNHAEAEAPPGSILKTLEELEFENKFAKELPSDANTENRIRQVEGAVFTHVDPTPTGTEPHLVLASKEVAESMIGLSFSECSRPEFASIFSGNSQFPKSKPYAQCYGGHQFGTWAGQLGDGRAICLGEVQVGPKNGTEGANRWELQLKGAGRTPYSRMADGRAVMRSSVREYVASEAMAALGVPTTRALSLVSTGDDVLRDMFYNGNAQLEPGAVVCRVARSFIRFGTFQLPASRGDNELVKAVADFVIRHFYQEAESASNKYTCFLELVCKKTGYLVSEWHRVGFVHGVLNTDNMSIIGDTIDYGPYGWLERFDPNFTPNTTDLPGRRYSFQSQPEIGQFNVIQLARALVSAGLLNEDEASSCIAAYGESLLNNYNAMMAKKMGLQQYDAELARDLLSLMYSSSADYTNTFRALGNINLEEAVETGSLPSRLKNCFGDERNDENEEKWIDWLKKYQTTLSSQSWTDQKRREVQNATNPAIVPRNHVMVSIISDVESGNAQPLVEYMNALLQPYTEDSGLIKPEWLEPAPSKPRLGVELLSCSS